MVIFHSYVNVYQEGTPFRQTFGLGLRHQNFFLRSTEANLVHDVGGYLLSEAAAMAWAKWRGCWKSVGNLGEKNKKGGEIYHEHITSYYYQLHPTTNYFYTYSAWS
jgi:hypothetical protein